MKKYFYNDKCRSKTAIAVLVIAMTACLYGCDSFTEVDLPGSQLTSPAVFRDKATATAAMTDIYSKIRDYGLLTGYPVGLSNQLGLYSDELDSYGGSSLNFYNNNLVAAAPEIADWWNSSYNQVYAANAVAEGVQASPLDTAVKDQLLGEALFTRALLHFYLMQVFGPVPYIKTTDYRANSTASRLPEAVVYENVAADLETASSLLPEAYATAERVRPNKSAARALLARVYLYSGKWAEASNAASGVLNQNDLYANEADLGKTFLKESTATIWQLMPGWAGDNTFEGGTFIFTSGPPPSVALRESVVEAFEPGDLRKTSWTAAVTDGTTTWHHANKYKEKAAGESKEYSIVLRLAEVYLIRAEARARQGEIIGAREDLNTIRQLAGLPETTAATPDEIIAAVLRERRVELFTEFGHRFSDLKRTGNLDAVLSPQKPGWNTTDRLFPLPQGELLVNPNLAPQNEGY